MQVNWRLEQFNCSLISFYSNSRVLATFRLSISIMSDDFYCRYYIGHKGKFGHEFMEFEITSDGKLRYANNSNYKNDVMIRKEVFVGQSVIDEIKRIVTDSEVTAEDDHNWPQPDRVGRQELEIKLGKEHISFTVRC